MNDVPHIDRREFVCGLAAAATVGLVASGLPRTASSAPALLTKRIPGTGEELPVIGMGTWITFNVGEDKELRQARARVLDAFFEGSGQLIDSSPMYGSSQEVIGYALGNVAKKNAPFAADKIWTSDGDDTREQFGETARRWGVRKFDLMQVHNLVAWPEHLATLRAMKAEGKVRYIGITTSHGRRHDDLEKIMKTEKIDFVQLTYNMIDREAERRLLPLARDRGIAVIANRPFRGGSLIDEVQNGKRPLPAWAAEADIANWPQFLLKFIVSHPAVTCAIPATSQVVHMRENMGACRGRLPDEAMRKRMIAYLS